MTDATILIPTHRHAAVVPWAIRSADADFALSTPVHVLPDGVLRYRPADLARPDFLSLIRQGRNNFIGLTGAAHTRAAYDRLPHGWRPAPPAMATDIYMWQQICALPGFRGATARTLAAIHLPDPDWRVLGDVSRANALETWIARASAAHGEAEPQELLDDAVWRAAQDFKLRSIELKASLTQANLDLDLLRAPWWRKLGRQLLRFDPLRKLRGRQLH